MHPIAVRQFLGFYGVVYAKGAVLRIGQKKGLGTLLQVFRRDVRVMRGGQCRCIGRSPQGGAHIHGPTIIQGHADQGGYCHQAERKINRDTAFLCAFKAVNAMENKLNPRHDEPLYNPVIVM